MHVPGSPHVLDILLTQSAVEKKNEKIAQNHIAVFPTSTTFLHAYIPFLLMLKTTF